MAVTEEATQPNEPNNSAGRVRICYHNRWITACSILFSSVATIFAWVLVLQLTMKQGFLSYIGLSSQYFLKQPNSLKDPLTLHHIGELVAMVRYSVSMIFGRSRVVFTKLLLLFLSLSMQY